MKKETDNASKICQIRLKPGAHAQVVKAAEESGQDFSTWVREAVNEKLHRDNATEVVIKSLQGIDKRLRGLRSADKMNFAGLTTLAQLLIICIREPAGEALRDALNNAPKRERVWMQSVVNAYRGEAGEVFDEQTSNQEPLAMAAATSGD